ncbi:MAG TPA: TIR domain-containing protein [Ktedonobacterales bacterium]
MSAPRVFISHSSADTAYCRALVERLRAAGADVWYDDDNLRTGQVWHTIERELQSRPNFVVILTPSALASKEVERECRWADTLYGDRTVTLLQPIVAAEVDQRDIWLFLREYKRMEASARGPVSADSAAELLCGLLGIRPTRSAKSLLQRDVKEAQHQKITNVASHSFGVVVVDWYGHEVVRNLFKKQDALPATATKRYGTYERAQQTVEIRLMQNDELVDEVEDVGRCEAIGTAVIRLSPGLPAGSPIDITFELDSLGQLHIWALEPDSGSRSDAELEPPTR